MHIINVTYKSHSWHIKFNNNYSHSFKKHVEYLISPSELSVMWKEWGEE